MHLSERLAALSLAVLPVTLHGSGVELDDGRLAILFQAVLKQTPIDPSMIRGS